MTMKMWMQFNVMPRTTLWNNSFLIFRNVSGPEVYHPFLRYSKNKFMKFVHSQIIVQNHVCTVNCPNVLRISVGTQV